MQKAKSQLSWGVTCDMPHVVACRYRPPVAGTAGPTRALAVSGAARLRNNPRALPSSARLPESTYRLLPRGAGSTRLPSHDAPLPSSPPTRRELGTCNVHGMGSGIDCSRDRGEQALRGNGHLLAATPPRTALPKAPMLAHELWGSAS